MTPSLALPLVVETFALAEELKDKLVQGNAQFMQLAREYSVVDDSIVGGVMGSISRGTMPILIRNATENAAEGQIIGPIHIEERYCLLRVEKVIHPTFDEPLRTQLENEIFGKWLNQQVQKMNIKLNFNF
ncbi:MAG: peptidylprolyl isomerase [Spirulinaceae cyanobacterium]